MSKFRHEATGITVSVADSKDERFVNGWVPADADPEPKRSPARKK